ncbi:MAG: c-type cytochrome [Sulfuricurvum sp.]|nr:c-type cytochrome [Sulfuricurvum sp.]
MKYLAAIACSLLLIGCGDSAQTENASAVPGETNVTTEANVSETNQSSVGQTAAEVASPVAVPAPASKPQPEPKAAEPVAKAPAPAKTAAPAPAPAKAPTSVAVDGGALFGQKCATCHGTKAEKPALGKSQVIAGWSAQQVKEALKGYQAGTYGKEMKALMQGQVKGLDDAQIDALGKHISSL